MIQSAGLGDDTCCFEHSWQNEVPTGNPDKEDPCLTAHVSLNQLRERHGSLCS